MIQVWYKFPHQDTVHYLKGEGHSVPQPNSFTMCSFDEKERIYIDASHKTRVSLAQFTTVLNQQLFELPTAPLVSELDYEAIVKKGIEAIGQKAMAKVVLARQKKELLKKSPLQVFKDLCQAHINCFVHLVYKPNSFCSVGASPELLLKNSSEGLKSVSMAGTIANDAASFSAKENEEQAFVTQYITAQFEAKGITPIIKDDIIVNDQITHLYSIISSNKPLNASESISLLNNLHPTPAVCGYPLGSSKAFISNSEGFKRGFYSGFIGIQNNKEMELYVNLRCARLYKNSAVLYAGAGITKDSDPHAEYLETEAKMNVIGQYL